jgi:hypothetical protein
MLDSLCVLTNNMRHGALDVNRYQTNIKQKHSYQTNNLNRHQSDARVPE